MERKAEIVWTSENIGRIEIMAENGNVPQIQTLAETENNSIWKAVEPDGETTYNLQLNNVTINFFQEEWDEFLDLIRGLPKEGKAK
jgi:hypothetical protein